MEITYSTGPRYIDGVNIDQDANASIPVTITEQEIADPVTGIDGTGYQQVKRIGTGAISDGSLSPVIGVPCSRMCRRRNPAYENFRYERA